MGDHHTDPAGRERRAEPAPGVAAEASLVPEGFEHPRGTLAVVGVFGLLFALAWLGTYLFVFLERGLPHLHP